MTSFSQHTFFSHSRWYLHSGWSCFCSLPRFSCLICLLFSESMSTWCWKDQGYRNIFHVIVRLNTETRFLQHLFIFVAWFLFLFHDASPLLRLIISHALNTSQIYSMKVTIPVFFFSFSFLLFDIILCIPWNPALIIIYLLFMPFFNLLLCFVCFPHLLVSDISFFDCLFFIFFIELRS